MQRHRFRAREAPPLGRPVMRGYGAEQRLEPGLVEANAGAHALDARQAQVYVAEQRATLARQDHGAADECIHAAAVVQQRSCREQVGVQAGVQLRRYGETEAAQSLPAECPYTIDQILAEDWYPEPADSANGDAR